MVHIAGASEGPPFYLDLFSLPAFLLKIPAAFCRLGIRMAYISVAVLVELYITIHDF